jgi:hypothetical protein
VLIASVLLEELSDDEVLSLLATSLTSWLAESSAPGTWLGLLDELFVAAGCGAELAPIELAAA